jgi:streptogramin lyase
VSGGGFGIAIDDAGSVWSVSQTNNNLVRASNTGTNPTTFVGGGLSQPVALSIDGSGNIWIANSNGTISEFSNAGAPLTPSTGITSSGVAGPSSVAVDMSGNVWITNNTDNSLTEVIGGGAPTTTPLSVATQNATQGTKP